MTSDEVMVLSGRVDALHNDVTELRNRQDDLVSTVKEMRDDVSALHGLLPMARTVEAWNKRVWWVIAVMLASLVFGPEVGNRLGVASGVTDQRMADRELVDAVLIELMGFEIDRRGTADQSGDTEAAQDAAERSGR